MLGSIYEPPTLFLASYLICYFFRFVRSAHDTYLAFRY